MEHELELITNYEVIGASRRHSGIGVDALGARHSRARSGKLAWGAAGSCSVRVRG